MTIDYPSKNLSFATFHFVVTSAILDQSKRSLLCDHYIYFALVTSSILLLSISSFGFAEINLAIQNQISDPITVKVGSTITGNPRECNIEYYSAVRGYRLGKNRSKLSIPMQAHTKSLDIATVFCDASDVQADMSLIVHSKRHGRVKVATFYFGSSGVAGIKNLKPNYFDFSCKPKSLSESCVLKRSAF